MKRTLVRTGRLTFGTLLIVAGVISGFLPIIQGWVFILAGLTLMAPESHYARRVLEWAKKKAGIDSDPGPGDDGPASTGGAAMPSHVPAEDPREDPPRPPAASVAAAPE